MEIRQLTPAMGAEVTGLDASQPIDEATFKILRDAFNRHSLLLFRNQTLTEAQHVAFSRRFGNLLIHHLDQYLTASLPEIYVLSNVVQSNGKPLGNHKEGWNWHSDWSYKQAPSMGSVLYAREVPAEGADTLFASMHAAYEALPEATRRRIDGMKAIHSYAGYYGKAFADREPLSEAQKAATPDVIQPVVRTHPETGRKSLFVGETICKEIIGLPAAESEALLAELNAHAIRPEFVYRHRWQAGDLLAWDNRCTMHQATPYDDVKYRRVMHRTTIEGDIPF